MNLDLTHLMRLRLVVARFGEMDVARWWNTRGMLGFLLEQASLSLLVESVEK